MDETDTFLKNIRLNAKIIDEFLDVELKGDYKVIWDAARHYIIGGGKRLRPYLVLKTYLIISKDQKNIKKIIPAAAAVEILHTFTLIHDDIMDNDDTRRGIPSVHKKWGVNTAILAGDLLYSMVFILLSKTECESDKIVSAMKQLGTVCKELCIGQTMDMDFEKMEIVSVEDYIKMISLKTGALFKASAAIGAIIGGATNKEQQALERYGENIGIAFQIVDDILGLTADETKLGKPIGSDLREGKKTYPILYAISNLDEKNKKQLQNILKKKTQTKDDIKLAIKIIKESTALDNSIRLAKDYIDEAIKSLEIFDNSSSINELKILAQITVNREF